MSLTMFQANTLIVHPFTVASIHGVDKDDQVKPKPRRCRRPLATLKWPCCALARSLARLDLAFSKFKEMVALLPHACCCCSWISLHEMQESKQARILSNNNNHRGGDGRYSNWCWCCALAVPSCWCRACSLPLLILTTTTTTTLELETVVHCSRFTCECVFFDRFSW